MTHDKNCEFINSELKAFPPIEEFSRIYAKEVHLNNNEKSDKKGLVGFKIGLYGFMEGLLKEPQDFKYLYTFLNAYYKDGELYESLSEPGKSFIDDIHSLNDHEAVGKVLECLD